MPLSRITSASIANSAVAAADIADGTITAAKIISVANTQITGNIVSSQITSVANTQLTGTITGSQISSNTLSNTVFQTGSVENYLRGANLDFGMRNRIINGAMVIDQRNAGASVTPANGTYALDRWKFYQTTASKFSVQQTPSATETGYATRVAAGFTNYLAATSLSAYSVLSSDYYTIQQPIEAFNTADLAWGTANAKSVTLSFWVRSSLTGTFGGSIFNAAGDRSYPFTYTVNSANTWEYETITIAGDTSGSWGTTTGISLQICFSLGAGSTYSGTAGAWASTLYASATGATSVVGTNGATLYITGVQLEVGSQATSFDFRDYGRELILCQRYYQQYSGNGTMLGAGLMYSSTVAYRWGFTLGVTMRAVPTMTANGDCRVWGGSGPNVASAISAISSTNSSTNFVEADWGCAGVTTTTGLFCKIYLQSSGYVSLNAEL